MAARGEAVRVFSLVRINCCIAMLPAFKLTKESPVNRASTRCFCSCSSAHLGCTSSARHHVKTCLCYLQASFGIAAHETSSSLSPPRRHPQRVSELLEPLLPIDLPRFAPFNTGRRLTAVYSTASRPRGCLPRSFVASAVGRRTQEALLSLAQAGAVERRGQGCREQWKEGLPTW